MLTNRRGKSEIFARAFIAAFLILAQAFAAQTVLCQNTRASADKKNDEKNRAESFINYKLCWQNSAVEPSAHALLAANEKVLLPQSNGVLLALNVADGATAWRSDLGGEIVGRAVANQESVFVANKAQTNDDDSIVFVRAVSLETGITAWRVELPKSSQAALSLAGNALIAVFNREDAPDKQQMLALNAANGAKLWFKTVDVQATSPLEIVGDKIYYAGADNRLRALRLIDGAAATREFRLPHRASDLTASGVEQLLIRDQTGLVSAIRLRDAKKLWTLRLGAAVQQILLAPDGIVLCALDDFVYFHRSDNGKRRWFKRLASRPLGAAIIADKALLLAISGETSAALLAVSSGKTLGQIAFPADAYATLAPIVANNRLLVATSRGVAVWQPEAAECAARSSSEN